MSAHQNNNFEEFLRVEGWAEFAPGAVFELTGPDALAFLQGQVTAELRPERGAAAVTYALWLNQKGRVVADSEVVRVDQDHWWLLSREGPADVLRERIEGYLIADEVTVTDHTADWSACRVSGRACAQAWLGARATLPAPGEARWIDGSVWLARRHGAVDTWEIWGPRRTLPPPPAGPRLSPPQLEQARVAAGAPAIPRDLGAHDLPNEGRLEEVAISYTKGCYLGQEVIARLKSMGRVRRRLLRVAAREGVAPSAGTPLRQGERVIGDTRTTVEDGRGGWFGFAMLALLHLDPAAPLQCGDSGDEVLIVDEVTP